MRDQGTRAVSDDDDVGISDVDCTPKPRWRESQADFERRMARMGANVQALRRQLGVKNRNAALRTVLLADGTQGFATRCACNWHGLAVADSEIARREYDAHACGLEGVGPGQSLHRNGDPLGQAWVDATKAMLKSGAIGPVLDAALVEVDKHQVHGAEVADDFEARVAQLEMK